MEKVLEGIGDTPNKARKMALNQLHELIDTSWGSIETGAQVAIKIISEEYKMEDSWYPNQIIYTCYLTIEYSKTVKEIL